VVVARIGADDGRVHAGEPSGTAVCPFGQTARVAGRLVGMPIVSGHRPPRYRFREVGLPEQTFSAEGSPKLAFTAAQLVWALVLGILGGHFVGSGSVGDIFGYVLFCAAARVALHAILWLRSRVVVSPGGVQIVGAFRRRTITRDQLGRFEAGTNIQGRPLAVLVLRSGKRKPLYATLSWWGKEHRQAVQSTVGRMNAAAGIN